MSEGQGILGNYPVAQTLTDLVRKGSDSRFGYSMPNVLRKLGYNTTYVHSHSIEFYSRGTTHNRMGFDNVVGKEHIKDENGNRVYNDLTFDNWAAEGDFAQNAINYLVPEDRSKPFYTFYLNVSSHGAYIAEDNVKDGDAIKYYNYIKYGEDDCEFNENTNAWELINKTNPTPTLWYKNALENHPEQAEELVYYECGVKGLDDAIGVIISKLKAECIYDETTLLLYSDHNAYYEELSHKVKGLDPNNNNTKELNIIPMIISSPGLKIYNSSHDEKFIINDRFSSSYDVIPTLFDLLGVKFNENLYLGHSLFRPSDYIFTENGVTRDMVVYYSNTGGLYGDDIYTFNLEKFITSQNYSKTTIQLFKAECSNLLTKINFLGYLTKYDLYRKLTNI